MVNQFLHKNMRKGIIEPPCMHRNIIAVIESSEKLVWVRDNIASNKEMGSNLILLLQKSVEFIGGL